MKKLMFVLSMAAILFVACENTPQNPIAVKKETKNGQLIEYEMDTVKGVKHGFYKIYHADNKTVFMESHYQNDTLEGSEKRYHENEQLAFEANYVKGLYEGSFKEYYEDGKVLQEGIFKAGGYEGDLKTYHPNGQLREKVVMVNGFENGPFVQYHENGKLLAKGTFKYDGKKAQEYCLLELYKEDGSGELDKKMICDGKGAYCTIWNAEEGDVEPSSDLCAEIIEKMKAECNPAQ